MVVDEKVDRVELMRRPTDQTSAVGSSHGIGITFYIDGLRAIEAVVYIRIFLVASYFI